MIIISHKVQDDTDALAYLCVKAKDTGNVLLLKRRSHSEIGVNNPGAWEFPGGHVKKGEHPLQAAVREWNEEVGRELPPGEFKGIFQHGKYDGYIYVIKKENEINLSDKGKRIDPDDPDNKHHQLIQWWKIKKIKKEITKGNVRHRLHDVKWKNIKKASNEKEWYDR